VLGLNVVGAKVEMTTTIKRLKALADLKEFLKTVEALQRRSLKLIQDYSFVGIDWSPAYRFASRITNRFKVWLSGYETGVRWSLRFLCARKEVAYNCLIDDV